MTRSLTMIFETGQAEISELTHRVQNFGEDVYRYLQTTGLGEIELAEIDTATTQLVIRRIKTRNYGTVKAWIERKMRQHHLNGSISD